MIIKRYDSGLLLSNMYVIVENEHAIVIDPCYDTSASEQFSIDYLMLTHEHYDHIFGVNKWKTRCKAPLLCSDICAQRIRNPRKNAARHFDVFCELQTMVDHWELRYFNPDFACYADITFSGTMHLKWQGHVFKLIHIPGHSPGSTGVFLDNNIFFSGDSLLEGRDIELRFPGGSKKLWEETGKKVIESIPKGTLICPGHFKEFVLK